MDHTYVCFNCKYLDKSRREEGKISFRYGCNFREGGYVCGWQTSDKDLRLSYLGCSNWKPKNSEPENKQMSLSDFIKL